MLVYQQIPVDYPLASVTHLFCAGITIYAPMMRYKINQSSKSLDMIGLGGLGHIAVKFGKAFRLEVTVFSTSISKKEEALNLLGADRFVLASDTEHIMVETICYLKSCFFVSAYLKMMTHPFQNWQITCRASLSRWTLSLI